MAREDDPIGRQNLLAVLAQRLPSAGPTHKTHRSIIIRGTCAGAKAVKPSSMGRAHSRAF